MKKYCGYCGFPIRIAQEQDFNSVFESLGQVIDNVKDAFDTYSKGLESGTDTTAALEPMEEHLEKLRNYISTDLLKWYEQYKGATVNRDDSGNLISKDIALPAIEKESKLDLIEDNIKNMKSSFETYQSIAGKEINDDINMLTIIYNIADNISKAIIPMSTEEPEDVIEEEIEEKEKSETPEVDVSKEEIKEEIPEIPEIELPTEEKKEK